MIQSDGTTRLLRGGRQARTADAFGPELRGLIDDTRQCLVRIEAALDHVDRLLAQRSRAELEQRLRARLGADEAGKLIDSL